MHCSMLCYKLARQGGRLGHKVSGDIARESGKVGKQGGGGGGGGGGIGGSVGFG